MVPITLTTAIPLTSVNVITLVADFFAIGAVMGILALMVSFPITLRVIHMLRGLGGRG